MIKALSNAPDEVVAVHAAMIANAQQAWPGEDMDALRPVYARKDNDGSWLVGCNFPGFCDTMRHNCSGWFYRESFSGRDVPMANGYEEALRNARVCFTG